MRFKTDNQQVTQLLNDWRNGNDCALEQLAPIINEELHRLAVRYMQREQNHHTLQATALVNEAFIKLAGTKGEWKDKLHFFTTASRIMRHVLVDHAKSKNTIKRRMNKAAVSFDDESYQNNHRLEDIIIVDDLLSKLSRFDVRTGKVLELSLFGGLSNPQISEVVQVSLTTVERELRVARAWIEKHR